MTNRLLFLGTGSSLGTPLVGCRCDVCTSFSSFNQRTRPSAFLEIGGQRILIDAGPDLRSQMLRFGMTALDALILTHAHHDHTAGIDDLRAVWYKMERPLPFFLSQETCGELLQRFAYLFEPGPESALGKGFIRLRVFDQKQGEVEQDGISFGYTTYQQGRMSVNGLRFGRLAYVSDIHTFPFEIIKWLEGVDILILSALRMTPSLLHFSIDQALDFSRLVGAKKVWLTHVSHELDHEKTNAYLPPEVQLAYDGLSLEF